jgi:hypothetical protein
MSLLLPVRLNLMADDGQKLKLKHETCRTPFPNELFGITIYVRSIPVIAPSRMCSVQNL